MLTALVIDESPAARRQVTGLLELAGWTVHEAGDADDARWLNAVLTADLVVTAAAVPGAGSGAELLDELRRAGSTARFLVVTREPTAEQRTAATAAGALACLAAPIDASLLLDLLRRRTTAALPDMADVVVQHAATHDAEDDADLMDRLHDLYDQFLPTRFSAIDDGVRTGDPRAVAAAAQTLAGPSGQLGRPEVADVCQAIAADARRGILAHSLVSRLARLTGIDRRAATPSGEQWNGADRRTAEAERRRLAVAADAAARGRDLAGLAHAADAAAGRMAARRPSGAA